MRRAGARRSFGRWAWRPSTRALSYPSLMALLLGALVLSGCTSAGGAGDIDFSLLSRSGGGQRSSAPAPRRPPDALPLFHEDPAPILTSDDLFAIYKLVLENYVDQVEPEVLIEGALKGLQSGAEEYGLLPVDLALVETMPIRYTRDPERDWARFAARYDALLDKQGGRLGIGAIGPATAKGMLDALDDPHTAYLDREALQRQQSRGIVGIGVILSAPNQRGAPIIREVIAGGPAERAGLKVGDQILAIDGSETSSLAVDEAARKIRGADGSDVSLEIRSNGETRPRVLRLSRAPVNLPAVQSETRDGVGWLRVRSFQEGVSTTVAQTLQTFNRAGLSGWILDLRGNQGGDLEEVTAVASLFVGDEVVGIQTDRARRLAPFRGTGSPLANRAPTVVLVDGDTGSAAEVFAAAMKEYQAAVLLGVKTSGKVGLATRQQLEDGSAVQLTYRRILSPSGQRLNGVGVEPDIEVRSEAEDWMQGRDPQLERAILQLSEANASAS